MFRQAVFFVLLLNFVRASPAQWNGTTINFANDNQTNWDGTTGFDDGTDQPNWNETTGSDGTDQPNWNATTNYDRNNLTNSWNDTTNFDDNNQTDAITTIGPNPESRNFCETDYDCYGDAYCNQALQQCQCPMGWQAIAHSLQTVGKLLCLRRPCQSDLECLLTYGPNTRCDGEDEQSSSSSCTCDHQYKLDMDTQSCTPDDTYRRTVTSVPCFDKYACDLGTQFCNHQRQTCQCNFGQVLSEQNPVECERLRCTDNEQCSNLYGHGAACSFGDCSCDQYYHLNTTSQSCQLNKDIYCSLDMDCPSGLTCMKDNKCGCRFGTIFNAQDNTCEQTDCVVDDDCSNFGDDTYCVAGQCYCYHSSSVRMYTCNSKWWGLSDTTWVYGIMLSILIGVLAFASFVIYIKALQRSQQRQEESRRIGRRRTTGSNVQVYNIPPPAYEK